jgi:hypothetical protein
MIDEDLRHANAAGALWEEIEPGAHLVQFYDIESELLDTLEAFVAGGLLLGEAAIVIATTPHLSALRLRLRGRGFDLASLQMADQFIALDAHDLLDRITCATGPDPARFDAVIRSLLTRGRAGERRIRAFGEMVSLLWDRGQRDATLELERLWQRCCARERLPLLCAYPMHGFSRTSASVDAISEICSHHSAMLLR